MTRAQLEHIVRAAGAITDEQTILVLGSQAILGSFPTPPEPLAFSREADVCPMTAPEKADLISGAIGEISQFDSTFGYYAHGVGEETAVLPEGWKNRLIPIAGPSTGGATGLCLEVHDLAVSKLVAGRPKDLRFIGDLLGHGLANPDTLRQRLAGTALDDRVRSACAARLARILQV